jgi:hypothetical protein
MKKPRPEDRPAPAQKKAQRRTAGEGADLQPAPTGANTGSPAARVMKQFAKTKAESSGRS